MHAKARPSYAEMKRKVKRRILTEIGWRRGMSVAVCIEADNGALQKHHLVYKIGSSTARFSDNVTTSAAKFRDGPD